MLSWKNINFSHIDCNFNKCGGRAETTGHYNSCLYLDKEDTELTRKDNYEIIKKKDRKELPDLDPVSTILEKLFKNYKALSINENLMNGYHKVPPRSTLLFSFTTSSPITIRHE